jgi:quercetin dioxygenase-like cupin family protein
MHVRQLKEETMELKASAATAKAPADRFAGDVYVSSIATPEEGLGLSAALVRFTPSARTNWHVHATGQTLHVLEGVALVGTRDGKVVVARAGETVLCPPGVDHWHGATPDFLMAHLAMVATTAEGTTWLEPVSDEVYASATAR